MKANSLFKDFCAFACGQLASGDIDPTYPVLKRFYRVEKLSREQALWRTVLYLAWYDLGSAERIWRKYPNPFLPTDSEVRGLSTGTERRSFRGNTKVLDFLGALLSRASLEGGSLEKWVDSFFVDDPTKGWDRAREELQELAFAGPWASYKWADLLKHVHDAPITASDIGVGGRGETAGPIPGMVRLTGLPWQECANDVKKQVALLKRAQDAGVPFNGLDQLETALCDFNSLCKGGYYVGHDIDTQMKHLEHVKDRGLWDARVVFEDRFRGEVSGGWFGVRKELKTLYRDQKVLIT